MLDELNKKSNNLNKNQKIIVGSVGPILILLVTYWIANKVAKVQSDFLDTYGPFDFDSGWIAIIWIASVSVIGILEWLLFGKEN